MTKCAKPAQEASWSEWYDDVHLVDVMHRDPTIAPKVITRFQVVPKPAAGMPGIGFTCVTMLEFEGPNALAKVSGVLEAAAEMRLAGRMHPAHAVIDVQVLVAHDGLYGIKPEPSPALRGHIMAWVLPNDLEREAEWDAWYDDQHVPDMMHSGAFAAASRWVRHPRQVFTPNYITLYDVALPSIDMAVQRSAAVMPGIIAAGRKHENHVGALTLLLEPTGRYGGAGYRG